MYEHTCEYCDGIVREKRVQREASSTRLALLFSRMYRSGCATSAGRATITRGDLGHARRLHRVALVASGKVAAEKSEQVPVAQFV